MQFDQEGLRNIANLTFSFVNDVTEIFAPSGPQTEEEIQSLYKGQLMAQHYAEYRPRYPPDIFNIIISYHDQAKTNGHELAVDVCRGAGQSTLPLTKLFSQMKSSSSYSNAKKDGPND
nr:putative methyltransferase DD [Biomphalaria glabrata]